MKGNLTACDIAILYPAHKFSKTEIIADTVRN